MRASDVIINAATTVKKRVLNLILSLLLLVRALLRAAGVTKRCHELLDTSLRVMKLLMLGFRAVWVF